MKRHLLLTCLLLTALTFGSCRRAAQKAAEKIRIEAVEQITPKGLSSAEAVIRIANGTGHRLELEQAEFVLHYRSAQVIAFRLQEGIAVDRRTTASIPTRWRIRLLDPLSILLIGRDLRNGDPSQIFVSYTLEGRGGPVRGNLGQQMMPLSDFLRIFGVTMSDIQHYLNL